LKRRKYVFFFVFNFFHMSMLVASVAATLLS
jgi:hypothetical protein